MKKVVLRSILTAFAAAAICGGALSVAHADGNAPAAAPAVKAETPKAAAPAAPVAPAAKVEPVKILAPTPAPAVAPAAGTSPYTTEFVQGNDFDKWCEDMKKPCDWFCWGADYQYRAVYQNNNKTLSEDVAGHEQVYDRNVARIWTTISPIEDVEINARFMWSWYDYWEPESLEGTTLSEGFFDNLNVNFKNLFGGKSSFKVGRQDILLGEGWLVGEGTPGDGSRTGFFDAARLTLDMPDCATTADLIYINDHTDSAAWLKPINDQNVDLAEQNEEGAIAYFTNKSVENTDISPYFMYKRAEKVLSSGYDASIYTPGVRVAGKIDENWKYRAEGAYQFGTHDGADISAFGANTALQYFVNDPMNNNFRLQYEFLSGDDPDSAQYEGFDTLWGRWARFSNIYADAVRLEGAGRPADYSNLHRVGPGWSISPSDKVTIATDYYLLFADQSQGEVDAQTSDNGLFRGQLVSSVLTYKFNKHIAGHLLGEVYLPGNYYSHNNNDIATYARYQLVLTF
ncbi:MAG: alginate export family protein [Sedimentisphaerales bacterium]|nr:alginate export family protein [Sedimentisphaerales bacterium]